MKNSKRGKVDPFIVMDVMEAARKAEIDGKQVIHMEIGQPGTPAPKVAKRGAVSPREITFAKGSILNP